MAILELQREGHLINIINPNSNKKIRYNLKYKCLERLEKDGNWCSIKKQYNFFRDFSVSDLVCKEEHFVKLIKVTEELNPKCYNIGTFFERMNEALIYENYEKEGIRTERSVSYSDYGRRRKYILTKPLDFYHRDIITFFKKFNIEVTINLERRFIENYNLMKEIIMALNCVDLERKEVEDFFYTCHSRRFDEIRDLVNYKYDLKALIKYIVQYIKPFENLDYSESLYLLRDYYSMSNQIGRDVKRYPKYLASIHGIINANFNAFKQEYDEFLFKRLIKNELNFEAKEYSILVPITPKEIISEGASLNHCVSSYINRILKGECYIFFLRKTEKKEESLITLELKDNKITQAKGEYNRCLIPEEKEFLESYCKKKELILQL